MNYVSWEAARSRAWGELGDARSRFLVATNALSDPPTREELREWGNCFEQAAHHLDNLILILSVRPAEVGSVRLLLLVTEPQVTLAREPRIRDLLRQRAILSASSCGGPLASARGCIRPGRRWPAWGRRCTPRP